MAYADARLIHDADSHLMELDDCLDPFFTPSLLPRFRASAGYRAALQRNLRPGRSREAHADAAFRAGALRPRAASRPVTSALCERRTVRGRCGE